MTKNRVTKASVDEVAIRAALQGVDVLSRFAR
jgi:hypothetical protein